MKKILKRGLIHTLLIALAILLIPVVKVNAKVNGSDEGEVKNVVQKYFDNEFESVKNGHAVNQDDVIGNKNLKALVNLKYERKALWHSGLGNRLASYLNTIKYDSINLNGNECIINLKKDIKFSFSKNPDIISEEFDVEHIINLKKINNKWLIYSDIDKSNENDIEPMDDTVSSPKKRNINNIKSSINENNRKFSVNENKIKFSANENNINEEIKFLQEDMNTLDEQIAKFKEFKKRVKENKEIREENKEIPEEKNSNSGIERRNFAGKRHFAGRRSATASYKYNSNAAVSYALKYAYGKNSNYPDWIAKGTDCANFVSQCIYAGAPAMNLSKTWCVNRFVAGKAWINVNDQWNFLVTNTGTGPVAIDNTRYLDICKGDVINFWSRGDNRYSHTVIVTNLSDMGDIYFSGHTRERRNYSLDDAYASGAYIQSKQRTAHIIGYNK
ncbi:amidase domain-containing protein [Clostridium botulinum]|uniref:amidase domain-containing protein n=1 Tax=Clostridium botulinum TaxID=1491 RepID=UPI003A7F67B5